MMELKSFAIVATLPLVMALISFVIKLIMERPGATDVYTLSDEQGRKVDVVLPRHTPSEERIAILNAKAQELLQKNFS
ncbi:hypothetical protein [Massilia sp. erpn]|uniref:hypothetical protein n=1 Tax=Massilia sp. erpn TaxID=2738142 RepID=UPI002105E0F0|nr:hypothetical protein [Massilia sp. erpn]UTY60002.1 hypothetical protein HPQ68_24110 [Massilia sp. erpn]